jgi:hypothetical protein
MKELYMGEFFWSLQQQRDSCLLAFLLVVCKKEDSSSAALDVCSTKIRGQS